MPCRRRDSRFESEREMTEELSNKNLMLTVIRAFKDGDTAPLFAAVSPDIIWKSNAPPEFFRGGGETTGLAEMKARIALVFSQYTFVRFQPTAIVTQGDIVLGQFEVEAFHQRSGKTVKTAMSIRWTVRRGMIMAHEGFFDTASVLLQQGDVKAA
jgi:ketosteroid isomerase-like protein